MRPIIVQIHDILHRLIIEEPKSVVKASQNILLCFGSVGSLWRSGNAARGSERPRQAVSAGKQLHEQPPPRTLRFRQSLGISLEGVGRQALLLVSLLLFPLRDTQRYPPTHAFDDATHDFVVSGPHPVHLLVSRSCARRWYSQRPTSATGQERSPA